MAFPRPIFHTYDRDDPFDIPLDLNHAFRGKFDQAWAIRRMDGHTPSNRDEAHDVVPRHRVATVGVAGHDILDAPHLYPSYLMGGGLFRVHLRVLLAGF